VIPNLASTVNLAWHRSSSDSGHRARGRFYAQPFLQELNPAPLRDVAGRDLAKRTEGGLAALVALVAQDDGRRR
jgi:hypothetical protein